MLVATLLLAAPALALDRRGKPEAVCDATRLLNEFTDCHLPCNVHTQGNDVGSHCTTNFCGTDGVCCRQGVTGGACDGNVGCNGWHCCVCHPSGTSGPTGAPAVAIRGDPFTTFQGKKTQFYMPPTVVMPLIQCGHVEVFGRAVNSNIKNDDQQWFDMFQVNIDGTQTVAVEARKGQIGSAEAADAADADVVDKDAVSTALQRLRMTSSALSAPRDLTTLNVKVAGKAVNTTGAHSVNTATIAIAQDKSKSIGAGFTELVQFDTADLGLKVQSSVAGKFTTTEDRVRNLHVDIAFTNINAASCSGTLPEIWGVKSMSKATAKLLVPPKSQ